MNKQTMTVLKTYHDLVKLGALDMGVVKDIVQTNLILPKKIKINPSLDNEFVEFLINLGIPVEHKTGGRRNTIQELVKEHYPQIASYLDDIDKIKGKPLEIQKNGETIQVVFQPFWKVLKVN